MDRVGRRRLRRRGRVTLVTGGAGFIGTNLVDRLVRDGRRVRVYDNLSRPGVERNLRWLVGEHGDALEGVIGDVRDRHTLGAAADGNVEAVFHFAGQVAVTTSV